MEGDGLVDQRRSAKAVMGFIKLLVTDSVGMLTDPPSIAGQLDSVGFGQSMCSESARGRPRNWFQNTATITNT